MERSDRPSYRQVLEGLQEDLIEAVRVSENQCWHHMAPDSEEYEVYKKMLRMVDRVGYEIKRYPSRVSAEQVPSKTHYVAEVPTGRVLPGSRSGVSDGGEPPWSDGGQSGPDDPQDYS